MTEAIAKHEHLALISVVSCLTSELSKAGVLDFGKLQENIQGTAAAHRMKGETEMADAMHRLSDSLAITVRDPE